MNTTNDLNSRTNEVVIKLVVGPDDSESIVARFKAIMNDPSIRFLIYPKGNNEETLNPSFKLAEIHHKRSNNTTDKDKNDFYSLRLYTYKGLKIMVSGVETGGGPSSPRTQAIIDILKLTGLCLTPSTIQSIYYSPFVSVTIWNDKFVHVY